LTTIVPEATVTANGGLPPPNPAMNGSLPPAPDTGLIVCAQIPAIVILSSSRRMNYIKTLKRVVPGPLWPYLGALRRFVHTVPPRPLLNKKRLLADASLTEPERELLKKVSSRIYYRDGMYNEDGMHYYRVGLSAISCIDEALKAGNLKDVRSILDLPCGGGRVLRFLVHRFAGAEITACELASGAVEFCARTFGAQPAFSSLNLDEVSLDKKFDLIWCGSLVTHLNETGITALLTLFRRHLSKNGIMVFTTHGDFVARRLPTRDFDYGLGAEQIENINRDYPKTGYGFEDYPDEKNYGVSLTSPEWVRARVRKLGGLREVFFKECGWDNHQDVFGYVRE
jgi:SAM-dependent methyltransferase